MRCLTYTSAALDRDLTIIGDVRCVLHGMSSAPDTEWVVRFDRNLNTGGAVGAEARGQAALNTVFHDAMRPSRIVLPVVE